jgi:hypothetical protein
MRFLFPVWMVLLLPCGVGAEGPVSALLPEVGDAVGRPLYISDAAEMELSDEVIPYERFAVGRKEQYRLVTEELDDLLFSSNRERRRLIEERAMDDTEQEIPERRSLFGGERFLSPGPIHPGYQLPTGATWRPHFFAFGTLRTAFQHFERGPDGVTEWMNRLDLFGNLAFSGTERFLIGVRPFDREGEFTGYRFEDVSGRGWNEALNLVPQTFFFEGDFGEIFPLLDPADKRSLDYQFSVGRQPMILQDGMMVNDNVDAVAMTRHNLYVLGASNSRLSVWYGWNEVHRNNNVLDPRAQIFAFSSAFDYAERTVEADVAYVRGSKGTGGDGAYLGLAHLQRFGHWASVFRANASWALDLKTPAVGSGWLFTHELSRSMPYNSDLLYVNTFLGIDSYTSAARDPTTGGPLGRLGVLNRAVGIGGYGAPLSNRVGDTIGAALGYQHFFDAAAYHQLLVEMGLRGGHSGSAEAMLGALGAQYQWGFGRGMMLILGGFVSVDENGNSGYGLRSEMQVKF